MTDSSTEVTHTPEQMRLMVKVANAMGLPVDELGMPYRHGLTYVLDGETYHKLHDFDPINDPADAFRVQIFFGLEVDIDASTVVIREPMGPLITVLPVVGPGFEGRVQSAAQAVVQAAALVISRKEVKKAAGIPADQRLT